MNGRCCRRVLVLWDTSTSSLGAPTDTSRAHCNALGPGLGLELAPGPGLGPGLETTPSPELPLF